MNDPNDQQLLRDYVARQSEAAFTELVRRHVDLIYSAAIRMARDPHLAKDVTQNTFLALAQNARKLTNRPTLTGWLHATARNLASKTIRSDVRRRAREQEAASMNELFASESEPAWERVAPHLDAGLGELTDFDRDALLLRYFHHKSAPEMAQILSISEEAAQKRVSRAVERLRTFFRKRGVTVGAGGLVAVIAGNAVQAAPAGLAATLVSASLLGVSAAGGAGVTILELITMIKLKTGIIGALVVAGIATPLVIQHRADSKLREREAALQQKFEQLAQLTAENARLSTMLARAEAAPAPSLPSPPAQIVASSARSPEDTSKENIERILRGDTTLKLTADQAKAYLDENHRNAASLLAAYRTSGDAASLEEAMRNFPDDPQVAFEAVFKKDASPEERRRWLDAFKKSAPENALANYLSALEHFKSGETEQAVADLNAAATKPGFEDYTVYRWHADEEAYRSAGFGEAETTMAATWGLLLPQLADLRDVGRNMVDLANTYWQAGDVTSAQAALQMAIGLGEDIDGSKGKAGVPLITQLVGIAIERAALDAMDPTSAYGDAGRTVQDRLDELTQRRDSIKQAVARLEPLQPLMTPQDWIAYNSRIRTFGEENAIQWLVNKYGQQ